MKHVVVIDISHKDCWMSFNHEWIADTRNKKKGIAFNLQRTGSENKSLFKAIPSATFKFCRNVFC